MTAQWHAVHYYTRLTRGWVWWGEADMIRIMCEAEETRGSVLRAFCVGSWAPLLSACRSVKVPPRSIAPIPPSNDCCLMFHLKTMLQMQRARRCCRLATNAELLDCCALKQTGQGEPEKEEGERRDWAQEIERKGGRRVSGWGRSESGIRSVAVRTHKRVQCMGCTLYTRVGVHADGAWCVCHVLLGMGAACTDASHVRGWDGESKKHAGCPIANSFQGGIYNFVKGLKSNV